MPGKVKPPVSDEPDYDAIDCDVHGPGRMVFVCQHLVLGSKQGF